MISYGMLSENNTHSPKSGRTLVVMQKATAPGMVKPV